MAFIVVMQKYNSIIVVMSVYIIAFIVTYKTILLKCTVVCSAVHCIVLHYHFSLNENYAYQ